MNVRIFWVRAMKCMYAQTRPRFILSSEGVFWGNGVWTHVNSKGKIPSTENVPRGGSNPRHCGQRAQALPTELFRPPREYMNMLATETAEAAHPGYLRELYATIKKLSGKFGKPDQLQRTRQISHQPMMTYQSPVIHLSRRKCTRHSNSWRMASQQDLTVSQQRHWTQI